MENVGHRDAIAMPNDPLTVSLPFGVTLPVPRWSVSAFGVIGIIALTGVAYQQFEPPTDLVTLEQANHALSMQVAEYGRHLVEAPEREATLIDDPRGLLSVRVYADGCLLIQRRPNGASASLTRLVLDLTRTTEHHDGDEIPARVSVTSILPTLHAATAAADGRCLNPHPGNFVQEFGRKDGCVVEVWRTFSDTCSHMQRFNVCTESFESNADGSPKINWTRCVH